MPFFLTVSSHRLLLSFSHAGFTVEVTGAKDQKPKEQSRKQVAPPQTRGSNQLGARWSPSPWFPMFTMVNMVRASLWEQTGRMATHLQRQQRHSTQLSQHPFSPPLTQQLLIKQQACFWLPYSFSGSVCSSYYSNKIMYRVGSTYSDLVENSFPMQKWLLRPVTRSAIPIESDGNQPASHSSHVLQIPKLKVSLNSRWDTCLH